MTLKLKLSIYFGLLFTILYSFVSITIYLMFSDFRKDEFRQLLMDKTKTTIRLLVDVKEIDKKIIEIIDQNTINDLYEEKTLIFNSDYKLIYSSLDDTKITWSNSDLDYLKVNNFFFREENENEVFGYYYNTNDSDYFVIISALDNFGKRKLSFLAYLLTITYLIFTILAWFLSFYLVKNQIKPIVFFYKKISNINENNLDSRLNIKENSINEIDLIGKEFNFMMNRIQDAYHKQKEFAANVSHELRTPLTRISLQIENQLNNKSVNSVNGILNIILNEINQLNILIDSLLLLSKIDDYHKKRMYEISRLDEALFNSIDKLTLLHPDIKISIDFDEFVNFDNFFEIKCNQNLLEIAFINLIKNAYLYSNNKKVEIKLSKENDNIVIIFINNGDTISMEDQQKLFEPFKRFNKSINKNGIGLGLRIVHRILTIYNFSINYEIRNNKNCFILKF